LGSIGLRLMQEIALWREHAIAAVESADLIRNTLGPRGLSKLVMSPFGYTLLANDAHQIVKEISAGYPLVNALPVVRSLIQFAEQQARSQGDGTASTILWAAELLKQALALQDRGIHPLLIIEGFDLALQEASRLLQELAQEVETGPIHLQKMAAAALLGKVETEDLPFVSKLVARLFLAVRPGDEADNPPEELNIALDRNLKVFTRPGELLRKSRFIKGLLVNRHRADRRMPPSIVQARVALLDFDFSLHPLKGYLQQILVTGHPQENWHERVKVSRMEKIIEELVRIHTSVIFSSHYLPELTNHDLARHGIMAVERTKKSDLEKLARATGARVIMLPEEICPAALGRARLVEEKSLMGNRMTFLEGTSGRVGTLFLRSPTRGGLDEAERACRGALRSLAAFVSQPMVLPGGGAWEIYMAREITSWASRFAGKLQLVVLAFAKALEVIPRTLIVNTGADPLVLIPRLRHRQTSARNPWIGFNAITRRLEDMSRGRIWDSLSVKKRGLHLATAFVQEVMGVDELIGAETAIPAERVMQ
jgi:chaperonin GroEL (HSP60 family)